MTTSKPPRVRHVYEQYLRGEVTFDEEIAVSEAFLERFAREHADDPPIEESLHRPRAAQ